MNCRKVVFFIFGCMSFFSLQAQADDFFTGQKKAACEAIMCLSTGSPPHECNDSLKKYFKIMIKSSLGIINPKKTLEARKNFLNLCPDVDESDKDKVNTSKNNSEYSEYEEPENGCGDLSGRELELCYIEVARSISQCYLLGSEEDIFICNMNPDKIVSSGYVTAKNYCKSVKKIAVSPVQLAKCNITMGNEYAYNYCDKYTNQEFVYCRSAIRSAIENR